jgi:hypothetical protein
LKFEKELSRDLSKACQYVTTDEKVCKGLKYAFIKSSHKDLLKCITWAKNLAKVNRNGTRLTL